MRKVAFLVFAAVFTYALAFGAPPAMARDMTANDLIDETKKNRCEISVSEAKEVLDKGGHIFLDCREPKEFRMGHIPGAINIPRRLMEFKVGKKFPDKNVNILVYCNVGSRGCLTTCTLCRMGYNNVKNMRGGWKAWEKAGYLIE